MRDCFREHVTPERIVAAARALSVQPSTPERMDDDDTKSVESIMSLKPQDVIVDFSIMHYGMKDKNPLDFIKFYSKRNQNREYPVLMYDNHTSLRAHSAYLSRELQS